MACTVKMPGKVVKNSITPAGCLDETTKSMSPTISLNRRKLPAVLHRIQDARKQWDEKKEAESKAGPK